EDARRVSPGAPPPSPIASTPRSPWRSEIRSRRELPSSSFIVFPVPSVKTIGDAPVAAVRGSMLGRKTSDGYLLPTSGPIEDLDSYRTAGGGEGLARALEIGPQATISEIERSKLRGRGGAGFPTGMKWKGVAYADPGQRRFLVCNAAEGEPGTFKDRALLRMNPYQVLEGIAIGAFAVGAEEAYVGIKEKYTREV